MTLATTVPQIDYVENGATLIHAIPFQFQTSAEIVCSRILAGVETPCVLGVDYNVTGGAGLTGTVTKTSAGVPGTTFRIKRKTSRAQGQKYPANGTFPATNTELAFDHGAAVDQEQDLALADLKARALQVPLGELAPALPGAAARAGFFIAFDAAGNLVLSRGTGTDLGLRADLAALTGTSLISWLAGIGTGMISLDLQTALRLGLPLMLEHFGGHGDNGVTDNYDAYKKLAAYVNLQGGGKIALAPLKRYYIGHYVGDGLGTAANDLMFDGVLGLTIEGNGGAIDVNGNFNRAVTATQPLSAIKIRNSSRIAIRNIELNGNVQLMTKALGVTEPSAMGLYIAGCTDIELVNVESHHHAGDGAIFTGYWNGVSGKASRRVTAINLNCHHNARNNISIIQLRDATFLVPRGTDAAMAAGTYGGHAPKLGMDIEPDYSVNSAAPNTMDVNTGNITFYNSVLNNNAGNIFSCNNPTAIDNIRIVNPDWAAQAGGSTAINAIYFDVAGGVIEGGTIDGQDQSIAITTVGNAALTDVELKGVTLKGKKSILHVNGAAKRARVTKCPIICTATAPLAIGGAKDWPLQLNCAVLVYEENEFWMPKEAFNNEAPGAGDYHQIMQNGVAKRFPRNTYSTDLPANQGGATTAHFANAFVDANTSPIYDDKYTGTAPGATDTFRAQPSGTHPTTDPYNRNHKNANLPGSVKPGDAAYTFVATKSPINVVYDVPITAARAVSLDTTAGRIFKGARVRVVRLAAATGAFAVNVGTGPLKALATAGTWVECEYDGTAWIELAAGSL